MNGSFIDELGATLRAAKLNYHQLVLLLPSDHEGSLCNFDEIAETFGGQHLNISLELSYAMLNVSPAQRPLKVSALLEAIAQKAKAPLFLSNLEILFDKNLQQDTLRLLHFISRNRVVVACWNGSVISGRLTYAEIGHPEFRRYDAVEALVMAIDKQAMTDAAKNNREAGQA